MQYKKLGTSEVKVTPIAFGAWAIGGWMWGGAEEKDALRALRVSYDHGVTSIDTAPVYGFGKSEELIGKAMQGISRDKYQVLTKYGMNWQTDEGEFSFDTKSNEGKPLKVYRFSSPEKVKKECEDSLRRLKTDYIDLLQIHWPDNTTPISKTMSAVAELIKEGKVLTAGVCNYNVQQVDEALKAVQLVSNQVPYSMVNRGIEKEVVPHAIQNKMSILPYSPLQRGILSGKVTSDYQFNPGDTRADSRFYKPENRQRINDFLQKLKMIADDRNVTLSQLVINWTTRQPAMDCVLVGARNEKQVLENIKSLEFKLSGEELKKINVLIAGLRLAD
jgi:aryl-alcohol dehydrogenase-like predicted oxidoreductase